MKFLDSLERLEAIIQGAGFHTISTDEKSNNMIQIRTLEGAIVCWYRATGTIVMQGKKRPKEDLEVALRSAVNQASSVPIKLSGRKYQMYDKKYAKRVFVVHGHDDVSREQLELILHKLGLDPFVLANTGGSGLTIIEALEAEFSSDEKRTRFGIVLLTPDDFGYSKKDGSDKRQPRARQNVILEMGMLISSIGRANVAILKKGHVEVPTDAQGILYLPYNDHVKETVPRLVDRLINSGFSLSSDAIMRAST